jgi:TolB-like protein/class 3 adenylate cyclase/Tfp pilus assembly protein PilF
MEERRLTAILFSDISGYTAQMGENEHKALQVLGKIRKIHRSLIKIFHGNIIDEIGDGTFACFNSAVDAVSCAVELVRASEKQSELRLHIGVHLAEVMFSGHKAYGDGVNLTSRIQTAAAAGEILISEDVFRNIRNHEGIKAEFLGEKSFKNIKESIGIYRLTAEDSFTPLSGLDENLSDTLEPEGTGDSFLKKRLGWYVAAGLIVLISFLVLDRTNIIKESPPQTVEKSIAVLPFKNFSPDRNNDYFSDGMTEEVINYLSKIADLKVISRTSVEQYKNTTDDIKKIAKDLGVSNILEGSVRKDSNKIRITVQLIQAQSGFHLWSDEYDRDLAGVFEVQTNIAKEVAGVLTAVLTEKEKMLIDKRSSVSLTAYDFIMKAKEESMNYSLGKGISHLDRAVTLYNKALQIDSSFAPAYAGLGWSYYLKSGLNEYLSDNYLDSVKILGEKSLQLDGNCEDGHFLMSNYYYQYGQPIKALEEADKTLEINPNYISAIWMKSDMLCYVKGDFVAGLKSFNKTLGLYHGPELEKLLVLIGEAYLQIGIFDKAEYYFLQSTSLSSDSTSYFMLKALQDRANGKYEHALINIQKGCKGDSMSLMCTDQLAWSLTLLHKYRDALNVWLSVKNTEQTLNCSHRIGYLYSKLGNPKKGEEFIMRQIRYCEESIRLNREYSLSKRAQYDLAAIYSFLGNKQKALQYFDEVAGNAIPPYWMIILIEIDPMFDNIREDDKFKNDVRKLEDRFNAEHDRVLKMNMDEGTPII